MSTRRWPSVLWSVVRALVAVAFLAFTLWRVPRASLIEALARLDLLHLLAGVLLLASTLLMGAARWRMALVAFGARTLPPYKEQVRLYFVGMFFNTFVPGGVGGDLLRAELSRRAVGSASAAWASVVTERALGLAALMVWAAAMVSLTDAALGAPWLYLGCGVVVLLVCLALPVVARWRGDSDAVVQPRSLPLLATFGLGVAGHATVAAAGHAIVSAVAPSARWVDSLTVVPLAQVAVFFPATVGGLGVREAAFVELFGRLGVAETDATAAAFGFLAISLIVAGIGGVVHVATPTTQGDGPQEAS